MFSEILKIIPKLDTKDLAAMEKALQSRFTKLAKGFGKGLAASIKGGGIAGIALGLIDKLLNPLKEVQEAIDRTLKTSDDLATNAKQFNTSTGKLAKLVTLGKATGLDPDNLYMLITKFQASVAEAAQDPNKQSVVRNYVGQKDSAQGFFDFIQALQAMKDDNAKIIVQQQVFGEKQILKMADFLQSDFAKLSKDTGIGRISTNKATRSIEGTAALNDLQDALTAQREFKDLVGKGSVINEGMIRARDKAERVALERENQRIRSYQDLQAISTTVDKIMILVEEGIAYIGKLINLLTPFCNKMIEAVDKFMKSPMIRGVRGLFGGGKDN